MKQKYNIRLIVFLVALFYCSLNCLGQTFYTFKKWKSSYTSEQNKIVFLLDTTYTNYDKVTLLTMKIIRDNLVSNDIEVNVMLYPTDSIIDKNILYLRFSPLSTVQIAEYKGFKNYVYICKRIQIMQILPDVESKKKISTEVSISIDKFADNLEAFGIDFASKLLKHFNVKPPYKEFRINRRNDEIDTNIEQ